MNLFVRFKNIYGPNSFLVWNVHRTLSQKAHFILKLSFLDVLKLANRGIKQISGSVEGTLKLK